MRHQPLTKARRGLAALVDRTARRKERVVLTRRGERVAALVPLEDLVLLQEMEDRLDSEAADAALAEMESTGAKPIPYEKVRRELGL